MALSPQAEAPAKAAEESAPVPREDATAPEDSIETILSMIGG